MHEGSVDQLTDEMKTLFVFLSTPFDLKNATEFASNLFMPLVIQAFFITDH